MDTRRLIVISLLLALGGGASSADELDAIPAGPTGDHGSPPPADPGPAGGEQARASGAKQQQDAAKLAESVDCQNFAWALGARLAEDAGLEPTARDRAAMVAASQLGPSQTAACFRKLASARVQSSSEDVISTLLQTAGEVVVDRALAHAWSLLASKRVQGPRRGPPPGSARLAERAPRSGRP
jgi:hypothetical protein